MASEAILASEWPHVFQFNMDAKIGRTAELLLYRDWLKGVHILLSNSQAGPGRTVKQEQEEISRNHEHAF